MKYALWCGALFTPGFILLVLLYQEVFLFIANKNFHPFLDALDNDNL